MGAPWVSFDRKDCSGCKHLNERGYCEFTDCIILCTVRATIPEVKPQTNADRERSMSDEELADELFDLFAAFYDVEWSKEVLLDWLRQEVDNEN